MGVKDLISFVKKQSKEVFSKSFATWQEEENASRPDKRLRIAIDVPILAYKLAYASGTDALVPRILAFATTFTKNTGTPVFVFDGENLPEKSEEKAKRALAFQKRGPPPERESRRLFADDEFDIVIELGPAACKQPCKNDYKLMKEALLNAGYECATAKFEAEALCAYLCVQESVDAVLTEDSDAFAYFSPKVILKYGSPECIVVKSLDMCAALDVSQEAFIDFCVLLGNDFNDRIHLVGPVKALALLKKHDTLRAVLDSLDVTEEKKVRMERTGTIFRSFCFEELT